jgi:hypothetical protein
MPWVTSISGHRAVGSTAVVPSATRIAKTARGAPRREKDTSDGCAFTCRAARHHRNAERDPVAAMLGPTLSPSSRARGCATDRAESRTAAGRLLIVTDASAPIPVVPHRPAPLSSCAGPFQERARTPTATHTKNRLRSTTGPTARNTSRDCSRPRTTSLTAKTSPTARTGIAGFASAIVRTAAASAPGSPEPSASQLARCGC